MRLIRKPIAERPRLHLIHGHELQQSLSQPWLAQNIGSELSLTGYSFANNIAETVPSAREYQGPKSSPKKRIQTAKYAEYAEKWNTSAYFAYSAVLSPFYFGDVSE